MPGGFVTLPRPPRGIDFPKDPNKWACDLETWARVSAGLIEDESRSHPAGFFLPLTGGTISGDLTVQGTTTLGVATATTPLTADNSTNVATTAWVKNQGYATSAALGNYVLKAGD